MVRCHYKLNGVQVKPLACPHQCQCQCLFFSLELSPFPISEAARVRDYSVSCICTRTTPRPMGPASAITCVGAALSKYSRVFALVKSSLCFWNACCWAFPHLNWTSFLVSIPSGSAVLARFHVNQALKLTNPRKLLTSDAFCSVTLASVGLIPCLDSMFPINVNWGMRNWHLSLFKVSPLSQTLKLFVSFWSPSVMSHPCAIISSETFATPSQPFMTCCITCWYTDWAEVMPNMSLLYLKRLLRVTNVVIPLDSSASSSSWKPHFRSSWRILCFHSLTAVSHQLSVQSVSLFTASFAHLIPTFRDRFLLMVLGYLPLSWCQVSVGPPLALWHLYLPVPQVADPTSSSGWMDSPGALHHWCHWWFIYTLYPLSFPRPWEQSGSFCSLSSSFKAFTVAASSANLKYAQPLCCSPHHRSQSPSSNTTISAFASLSFTDTSAVKFPKYF